MPFIRVTPSGGTELRNFSLTSAKYRIGGGGERFKREGHRRAACDVASNRYGDRRCLNAVAPFKFCPSSKGHINKTENRTRLRPRRANFATLGVKCYSVPPEKIRLNVGFCRNFSAASSSCHAACGNFQVPPLLVPFIRPRRQVAVQPRDFVRRCNVTSRRVREFSGARRFMCRL